MTTPMAGAGPGASGDALTSVRRSRVVATLVVAVALLTGILVGVAADRRLLWGGGRWGGGGGGGVGGGGWGHGPSGLAGHGQWEGGRAGGGGPSDRMRQRFASELGLNTTQIAQVDSIMARRTAERRVLEDSMRPRMRALLDSTRSDIDRVLTPDQRKKLDAWRSRAHAGHGDAMGGDGPGGGPPGPPGPRAGRGDPDARPAPPGEGGP